MTLTPQQEQAKADWERKKVDQQVQYLDEHATDVAEVLVKTPAATGDACRIPELEWMPAPIRPGEVPSAPPTSELCYQPHLEPYSQGLSPPTTCTPPKCMIEDQSDAPRQCQCANCMSISAQLPCSVHVCSMQGLESMYTLSIPGDLENYPEKVTGYLCERVVSNLISHQMYATTGHEEVGGLRTRVSSAVTTILYVWLAAYYEDGGPFDFTVRSVACISPATCSTHAFADCCLQFVAMTAMAGQTICCCSNSPCMW